MTLLYFRVEEVLFRGKSVWRPGEILLRERFFFSASEISDRSGIQ